MRFPETTSNPFQPIFKRDIMSIKCSKCGSELPIETTFCPTCGNRLIKSNLGMTSNLILIYGVVAIIIGLFFAAGLSVIDQAWNDIAGPDGTYDGITYDLMVSVVQWTAVAFLSSGVCALVSGILARKQVYGKVCLILCVLASVLVFAAAIPDLSMLVVAIILFIVGMYMSYRLYAHQDEFCS